MQNKLPWFLKKGAQRIFTDPKASYAVLDFETDTEEYGSATNLNNSLVLACWHIKKPDQPLIKKSKYGNEYEMHELLEDLKDVDFVVAQNAKFELQWLKRCGAELRDILVYDTMLGAWVEDGNLVKPRDMNSLAKRYGIEIRKIDLVSSLIHVGWNPRYIPRAWLEVYCHRDVELAHEIFLRQRKILEDLNLLHIALTRFLTCAVLADIEFEGMCLDKEAVLAEYEKVSTEAEQAKRRLEDMADGVNLASPLQLAKFLYEDLGFEQLRDRGQVKTTPSGKPLTNADTLLALEVTTEKQREFIDLYRRYNKLDSLLSKSLIFFKGVVDEYGGKFKAIFNQNITQTHRLSSSGRPLLFSGSSKSRSAQFQNLPRDYKRLFYSGLAGWLIGEVDGAQLEFRVGADLGRDEVAKREIEEWFDVHSATREELLKAGDPEIKGIKDPKEQRQQSKKSTFAPLYGGKGKTKAQQAYVKFFVDKYKQIAKTQNEWVMQVLAKKQLITPYGLRFYWPNATMGRWGDCNKRTEIFNYPVQGMATGEIIPIALVHFWHRVRGLPIVILNTIHDSIVVAVREDYKEIFSDIAKQAMTFDVFKYLDDIYNYEFQVPLGVGIKISRNWGYTKEEVTYNCFRDGSIRQKEI